MHPIRLALAAPLALAVAAFSAPVRGSRASSAVRADSLPPLAAFFVGTWSCRGGTPAGRVMTARVTFTSALDGKWIQSEHMDDPPGKYHSLGVWPVGASNGQLAMTVYDNFGGARRFVAVAGWAGDSIVWMRDTTGVHPAPRLESFTYKRVAGNAYWYAWHVARTPGGPFVLGDSSTCRR